MPSQKSDQELTMLGQLIAEISKFGGFDKEKSRQLASILVPHCQTYTANAVRRELEKIAKKQLYMIEKAVDSDGVAYPPGYNGSFYVPLSVISDTIKKYGGDGNE